MFELSLALRYLIPRKRKLSLSIISLVSVSVISLVVWLVLVFMSITEGMEKKWLGGLASLYGPCRITLTEHYTQSYDCLIDRFSEASNFETLPLSKKRFQASSPHDPAIDPKLPEFFTDHSFVGVIPQTFDLLSEVSQKEPFAFEPYTYGFGELSIAFNHPKLRGKGIKQHGVIHSFFSKNPYLSKILAPPSQAGIYTLYAQLKRYADSPQFLYELKRIINNCDVELSFSSEGKEHFIDNESALELLDYKDGFLTFKSKGIDYNASLGKIYFTFQNPQTSFTEAPDLAPLWPYTVLDHKETYLPFSPLLGEGILVSTHLHDQGLQIADSGYIAFQSTAGSTAQEMKSPCFVSGFYSPGVGGLGSKLIYASLPFVEVLASNQGQAESEGIYLWADLEKIDALESALKTKLERLSLDSFWNVETFKSYDFSKELVQQLQSDRMLLTLIAGIILLVAASNIITMLILLVNDKKKEIGILHALGARPRSIACLFALCGLLIGLISATVGTLAAELTLSNIDYLVAFLSKLQGHTPFSEAFYGKKLPSELSYSVLKTIWIMTLLISMLAGLVPAFKASRMKPTEILRNAS